MNGDLGAVWTVWDNSGKCLDLSANCLVALNAKKV